MLNSVLIYIALILLTVSISWLAQITNKRIFLNIIIVLLSFVIGFRGEFVGIDTPVYYEKMTYILYGYENYIYGMEDTFKYFCINLLKICPEVTFAIFIIATLTISLIVYRLWDFKNIASYPMMMLVFCCCFMFYSFNIMRQMCAVAIVFYATRYLDKKEIMKFLIIASASLIFHYSGVLCILYLGIYLFLEKNLRKLIMISSVAILAFLIMHYLGIIDYLMIKQQAYFNYSNNRFGYFLPLKCFLFIVSYLFCDNKNKIYNRTLEMSFIASLLGLFLTSIGYVFAFMERIGLYFYLYETCFIGILSYKQKYSTIFLLIYVMMILVEFILAMLSNSQGQVPYTFIF